MRNAQRSYDQVVNAGSPSSRYGAVPQIGPSIPTGAGSSVRPEIEYAPAIGFCLKPSAMPPATSSPPTQPEQEKTIDSLLPVVVLLAIASAL